VKDLFSINRAADLLEKDRATLVRALRHVLPDGYAPGGHPRYTMATISAALAVKPQARRNSGKMRDRYSIRSAALDTMRRQFEEAVEQIAAEGSPDRRRELALKLAPLLQEYQTTYLAVARELHLADDDAVCARAELIWSEMMDEVSQASRWPRHGSDFFIKMFEAMPHDDEAA
jgi:hypothetical protein